MLAAIALGAVLFGVARAIHYAWITDDAYISFRYARNLVRGLGLVFNAGERVEGYTNFLWTLWCAVGIRLGLAPETWTHATGIACYALTIALLAGITRWRRGPFAAIPVAALGLALHRDAAVFATSGLEVACFTLLALAGYLALLARPLGARAAALGALGLGLAALTRPDGALFVALGGAFVLGAGRPRGRAVAAYAAVALALLAPYAAWKLAYYGDLVPNTYHAKSAFLSWWGQGLVYLALYLAKYWPLALAVPLAAGMALRAGTGSEAAGGRETPGWGRAAGLAAAFGIGYAAIVTRAGGDFMYARLLIPATPFLAILLELGLERYARLRPQVALAAAAVALAGISFTPGPLDHGRWIRRIVDERDFYRRRDRPHDRRMAEELRRYFDGLPVRVAFGGTQALAAYYSEAPVAIESHGGLTDRLIARLPLARRGRPGHEKSAPALYLIEQRGAHLYLTAAPELLDSLAAHIPIDTLMLGDLPATVLNWDPGIVNELVRRGARGTTFLPRLDAYLRDLASYPDSMVRADYRRLRRFYFAHARDSVREAPFLARLGLSARADSTPRARASNRPWEPGATRGDRPSSPEPTARARARAAR